VRNGPAPLAFWVSEYSPAALLADHPPSNLLPPDVRFLNETMDGLPMSRWGIEIFADLFLL
jgi:hypothetical protein